MPKPISWRELVRRLREMGFEGPAWGGKHPFMIKGSFKLRIPNDHSEDIRPALLKEILRQAKISLDEWGN
jgi:predicted RNA binding protein YcfA (HicA-like mRNA interferase family)